MHLGKQPNYPTMNWHHIPIPTGPGIALACGLGHFDSALVMFVSHGEL